MAASITVMNDEQHDEISAKQRPIQYWRRTGYQNGRGGDEQLRTHLKTPIGGLNSHIKRPFYGPGPGPRPENAERWAFHSFGQLSRVQLVFQEPPE